MGKKQNKTFCVICGKEIIGKNKGVRYCSAKCSTRGSVEIVKEHGMETSTLGAFGELCASAYFLKHGWLVFRSLTPNSPYDLIIAKNNTLFRVEVKTSGELRGGRVGWSLKSKNKELTDFVVTVLLDGTVKIYTPDKFSVDIEILEEYAQVAKTRSCNEERCTY